MVGRKKKPTHLKVVSGTFRPDREAVPKAQAEIPPPPAWLSERAREIFDDLAVIVFGMGVITLGDGAMLALLASRIEEVEITTGVVEDLGRSYAVKMKSGDVMMRARPEVAMRNEALRHAQSLLAEFGLSPASAAKVSRATPAGVNPFAEL